MNSNHTPFSAVASATGYLFQCRYALLEGLRRLRKEEDFTVSIETLDDVVFEKEGKARELLQAKHHLKNTANLTDASPDLWKTIRVWCEGISNGIITEDSTFYLLTTATASKKSAAFYLKPTGRDVPEAIKRLKATAATSDNKKNKAGYSAFRNLSDTVKENLFNTVYVLDAALNIVELDTALREEVFYAVERRFLEVFLQRLDGWWLRRIIKHFASHSAIQQPILSEELQDEMSQLREQFKLDNLPIDDDLHYIYRSIEASGYENELFVKQLRLIDIGNPRILHAIRNYLKAAEQRSRWMREELLMVGELDHYEDRLVEEWELYFERMKDELGTEDAKTAKSEAAKAIYKWVETDASFSIRPNCHEAFITRGSYQMLSNQLRVGWHPEFKERLQHLLEHQERST